MPQVPTELGPQLLKPGPQIQGSYKVMELALHTVSPGAALPMAEFAAARFGANKQGSF